MPVKWCAGEDDPPLAGAVRIDDLYELACWLAEGARYISGTIRALRTWPRPWERRFWRSSGRPTPRFGRRGGRTYGWGGGDNGDTIEERGNPCELTLFPFDLRGVCRGQFDAGGPRRHHRIRATRSRELQDAQPEGADAGVLADAGVDRDRPDQLRSEFDLGSAAEGAAGRDPAALRKGSTRRHCARSPISPSSSGPTAAITTR